MDTTHVVWRHKETDRKHDDLPEQMENKLQPKASSY